MGQALQKWIMPGIQTVAGAGLSAAGFPQAGIPLMTSGATSLAGNATGGFTSASTPENQALLNNPAAQQQLQLAAGGPQNVAAVGPAQPSPTDTQGGLAGAINDLSPLAGLGLDVAGKGMGGSGGQAPQLTPIQRGPTPSFPLAQFTQPQGGKIKPAGVGASISTLSPNAMQSYAGMLIGGMPNA